VVMMVPERVSYVLPIRRRQAAPPAELTAYLMALAQDHDVIVVDNSPPDAFAANALAWGDIVRHLPPDPDLSYRFGKVNNVITGVRHAACEKVVVADDDVRWPPARLAVAAGLLDQHHLVWPQNVFVRLPWHARLDTSRTLLNRAFGHDYPGTVAVRRSVLLDLGGYDGDCLFENLELLRTIRVAGGTIAYADDVFVPRLPPTTRHFWSQRVRQAYDEFALPHRMVLWLAIAPVAAVAAGRRRAGLAWGAALACALAERGRRRAGGRSVFPPTCSLLAPVWVAERAVCAWLAVATRLWYGGARYDGTVLVTAAHSERQLRARHAHLVVRNDHHRWHHRVGIGPFDPATLQVRLADRQTLGLCQPRRQAVEPSPQSLGASTVEPGP
jgi:hypothetical protein